MWEAGGHPTRQTLRLELVKWIVELSVGMQEVRMKGLAPFKIKESIASNIAAREGMGTGASVTPRNFSPQREKSNWYMGLVCISPGSLLG
jgi:hypothetical protein